MLAVASLREDFKSDTIRSFSIYGFSVECAEFFAHRFFDVDITGVSDSCSIPAEQDESMFALSAY
jgi:hypothetical protein